MRDNGRAQAASSGIDCGTSGLKGILRRCLMACALAAVALTACALPPPNFVEFTPTPSGAPTASATIAASTDAIAPPPPPIASAPIAAATTSAPAIAFAPIASPTPSASAAIAAPTIAPPPKILDISDAAATSARLAEAGLAYLTAFTERFSPRESGTDEERAAAEFLADEMRQLGYDVVEQPLTVALIDWDIEPVSIVAPDARALRSRPLEMSGSGDVTAPLAYAGKALQADIPADGLAGSIALIERGGITFEEKATRAADAGALGAIIYNNAAGEFGGTLMRQASIPAAAISREDGLEILAALEDGTRMAARIRVEVERRSSQNIIAEKRGTGADSGVVVLGAHYDSVAESQGAGDNGTGVAALAVMAQELADAEFPFTLRFIFFGVEEIGLRGSRHYVENLTAAELRAIDAMLNFDAMGAGKSSILGDGALVNAALGIAAANGLIVSESDGLGGSDHAPFRDAGVPALFFFGDDYSRINSPADELRFVDASIMGTHMTVALRLLRELASDGG